MISQSTDDNLTVLLAGVGGQGIVMAGDVVAEAAFLAGWEVKKSEIHGLSRRFGSVSCQVRLGRGAMSPLKGLGGVDLLLAAEAHEAMRNLPYLKKGGVALVNRLWIATSGRSAAPHDPAEQLNPQDVRLLWLDATDAVHERNATKCLNTFLVGALSQWLPVAEEHWPDAIRRVMPEAHYRKNLDIFRAGRESLYTSAPGE